MIQALRGGGFDFIADQILETDPNTVEAPDEVDSAEDKQKFDQLQSQLWMQTQLMMKFKEDIDKLQEKVKKNEAENEVFKEKFSELEQTMRDKGLSQEEVLAYLKDYAGKKEHPNLEAVESPDGSDVDIRPSLRRISMGDPTNLTEAIARHLGVDVVRYMALGDEIPASNRYAQTMRKTVTFMTNSNRDMFNEFLKVVKLDDIKGFSTLSRIADELFRDGVNNWGRVVALYAFGGYVATYTEDKDGKLAEMIGDFLGFYVSTHLSEWIDEHGGWVSYWLQFFIPRAQICHLDTLFSIQGKERQFNIKCFCIDTKIFLDPSGNGDNSDIKRYYFHDMIDEIVVLFQEDFTEHFSDDKTKDKISLHERIYKGILYSVIGMDAT